VASVGFEVEHPGGPLFSGPVPGELFDGLVSGAGGDVDGGVVAGATVGDVGEFSAAAVVGAWARSTVAPWARWTVVA
jgi:hypothetical protein